MRKLNIGLTQEERHGVIRLLNKCLADTYLLVIKTKKYHWDVTGPQFMTLHKLWEDQYEALSERVDAYAERIRALGGYPIGTASEFLDYASIQEHIGDLPDANKMVGRLVVDHEKIVRNLRHSIDECSNQFHDEGTADFLTGLMSEHEEMAWMLRAFIAEESLEMANSTNQKAAVSSQN